MNSTKMLSQLRFLAIAEGISYLLLGITMIFKYGYEILWPNLVVGMSHGVLFIAYCVWVLLVSRSHSWKTYQTLLALIASLIPVATFIVEAQWLRKSNEA